MAREPISELEQRPAELAQRRRGRSSWCPAEVSVIASAHGLPDRAAVDVILRGALGT